jgi:hypothetical protein
LYYKKGKEYIFHKKNYDTINIAKIKTKSKKRTYIFRKKKKRSTTIAVVLAHSIIESLFNGKVVLFLT